MCEAHCSLYPFSIQNKTSAFTNIRIICCLKTTGPRPILLLFTVHFPCYRVLNDRWTGTPCFEPNILLHPSTTSIKITINHFCFSHHHHHCNLIHRHFLHCTIIYNNCYQFDFFLLTPF